MTELQQASDSLTSAQITAKISFATAGLDTLRREENDLALAAVSGDGEAVKRIAEIRSQLRQIGEDVAILERARTAAQQKESEAAAARDEAYRARHLAIAREKAAELVKIGERTDEVIKTFKSLLSDLAETEKAIWNARREAAFVQLAPRIGQRNIGQTALEAIQGFLSGQDHFRCFTPVAERAACAWRDLFNDEVDSDD